MNIFNSPNRPGILSSELATLVATAWLLHFMKLDLRFPVAQYILSALAGAYILTRGFSKWHRGRYLTGFLSSEAAVLCAHHYLTWFWRGAVARDTTAWCIVGVSISFLVARALIKHRPVQQLIMRG